MTNCTDFPLLWQASKYFRQRKTIPWCLQSQTVSYINISLFTVFHAIANIYAKENYQKVYNHVLLLCPFALLRSQMARGSKMDVDIPKPRVIVSYNPTSLFSQWESFMHDVSVLCMTAVWRRTTSCINAFSCCLLWSLLNKSVLLLHYPLLAVCVNIF